MNSGIAISSFACSSRSCRNGNATALPQARPSINDNSRSGSQANSASAHLKTGSLRDVTALAGFVHANSGKRYVLVAMVNHANANAARPALDALIEWVVMDNQPP